MRNYLLINFLILVFIGLCYCQKPPAAQHLVPLPAALGHLPIDSTADLGNGYSITRVSPTKAVLQAPPAAPAKIKYKNIGNTVLKDVGNNSSKVKESGNQGSFIGQKKTGNTDQKNVGNNPQKKVGNTSITDKPGGTIQTVLKAVGWALLLIFLIALVLLARKWFA